MSSKARVGRYKIMKDEDQDEDLESVGLFLSGDERGFNKLHAKYRLKLIRFITLIINDSSRAEDLVQETFLRVFRHMKSFDKKKRFNTWIYTIARNLAFNEIRNNKRRATVSLSDFSEEMAEEALAFLEDKRSHPERLLNGREASRTLGLALRSIAPNKRRIFVLKKLHGKRLAEIAEIMMCPTGTVKSSVNRAIEAMTPIVKKRMF